jgi:hypothetical protein
VTSLSFDVFYRDHGAAKGLKDLGKTTETTAGKFSGLKTKAGLAAVGAAVGLVKFGKDSVKAYTDAQTQQDKLAFAFTKFPKLADTNIGALQGLNTELAKKTKFDDDATASGQAVLAQFGLTGTQITKLTPLLQDYAAKTGKDLPTAAKDLGKAVLGQGKSLKAVGIDFKDTKSHAGNFAEIMTGLRGQVGGFAEKEGKSAAGSVAILKNQFGELEETAGSKLVPALTKVVGVLTSVVGFVDRNSAVIGPLVGIVGSLAAVIWTVSKAAKAYAVVQGVLNFVLSANPIGLVIVAIGALVAGLIFAYKHSATFRAVVQAAMKGVVAAFHWVVDAAQTVWKWLKAHWPLLVGIITGPIGAAVIFVVRHWRQITAGAKAMKDAVVDKFWEIIHFVTGLPRRISKAVGNLKTLLVSKGQNLIDGFRDGAVEIWGKASAWLSGLPAKIKAKFAKAATWLLGAGRNLLAGLRDGMIDKLKAAADWAKTIGDKIVSAVKDFFGIKSPSTVFAGLGRNLIVGLIKGMINTNPVRAISHIFGSMPKALGALVDKGLASIASLPSKALHALAGLGGKFADLLGGASNFVFGKLPTGGNRLIGRVMAAAYGWTGGQWDALNALWTGESGWNNRARNPSSGAFGIPQALPPGKMGAAAAGGNAVAQIAWGLGYIKSVYGSPANAYARWLSRSPHWYGEGTNSARPGLAVVGENGPELLNMRGGEQVTPLQRPSYARVGGGAGTVVVHNTYNFPNYIGSRDELRQALVDMNRRGQLEVIKR